MKGFDFPLLVYAPLQLCSVAIKKTRDPPIKRTFVSSSLRSTSLRMLPGQEISIYLVGLIEENLTLLKELNEILFSLEYSDNYYADVLASGELTKLAYHRDTCVGVIACRREKKEDGAYRVYIMTIGVLAPYRRHRIGTKLMNYVLDLCSKENMSEIYLHVVADNEAAIKFYKRCGFEMTETIPNHYTLGSVTKDCHVFTKRLAVVPEKVEAEGKVANTDDKK